MAEEIVDEISLDFEEKRQDRYWEGSYVANSFDAPPKDNSAEKHAHLLAQAILEDEKPTE